MLARAKIANLVETLRSSYWFLPTLLSLGAVVLAFVLLLVDRHTDFSDRGSWSFLYTGGPEGARKLLSTIASSMITVAGVVFSITIVALTLASNQFGPRLLRSFMRDRGNQVVLGTFVATYVYCLLVLRTIRGTDQTTVVPNLAVTISIILAICSLGVLIYFIHHVAFSIQAPNIINAVWQDLRGAIDQLFPEQLGEGADDEAWLQRQVPDFDADGTQVAANQDGYIRALDEDELMDYAARHGLVIALNYRPGQYVTNRAVIARVSPADAVSAEELRRCVNEMIVYGSQRTLTQDAEFAINQLVEVAVRSLSTGINDPDTAITSIDHLGSALCLLATRKIPSRYRQKDKRLRVIAQPVTFVGMLDAAVHQIRQYGQSSAPVLIHLLQMLAIVSAWVRRDEDQQSIRRHADLVWRSAERSLMEKADLADARERFQRILVTLERCPRPPHADSQACEIRFQC